MNKKPYIPTDPVFFLETVLGCITTARGKVMKNLIQYEDTSVEYKRWESALRILGKINSMIYRKQFSHSCAEKLVQFMNDPSNDLFLEELAACA